MILIGPTLRIETETGQKGKVTIFVDGSESMSIKDKGMSPGRKLLIAQKHGWLPADQGAIDTAMHDASDELSDAHRALSKGLEEENADLQSLRKNFTEKVREIANSLSG